MKRNLVLIVIAAVLLSACTSLNIAASPTSVLMLNASPRIENCGIGERQRIINTLRGEANPNTATVDGITLNEWLDGQMGSYPCIAK